MYGINDASHFYFDRSVSDLSLNQMFILACIPAVPTRGNSIQHPEVFERVRNGRLDRLIEEKQTVLSPAEMAMISAPTSC
ncbi:MAG: transglycosylase domain-containing protein [Clostridia bacterium]|nr:transglycosylase domain-containing protein [Clostridia bacterium]